MNTAPDERFVPGQRPGQGRGATALGTDAAGRPRRHPRHLVGNTLRAAKVFVGTAFDVLVLGDHEGRPDRPARVDRPGGPEHPGARAPQA